MKVLFVSSGNSNRHGISVVQYQKETLEKKIELDHFRVESTGLFGYLISANILRKYLKKSEYDVIHAHYTLSGWTAVLAKPKLPIVLSLMGSDAYGIYRSPNKIALKGIYLRLLTKLIQPFVNIIICKSKQIEEYVYLKKKSRVIPNGIDMELVKIQSGTNAKELGLTPENKNLLFIGDPTDRRKNFSLVESALKHISSTDISLICPYPINQTDVIKYLNSVDAVISTSLAEGSPNVIKEAMACNCPIVSTEVGDVKWVIGDTPGCFISSFEPEDVAEKIRLALEFAKTKGRTNGRQRILELGLDSETIANRLIAVYEEVTKQ